MHRTSSLAAATFASLAFVGFSSAAPIIYESFSQATGSLNGAAGGTGLSGNWAATTGTYPVTIAGGTATYGSLSTKGNRVHAGANPSGAQVNTNASISTGSSLSDAGRLGNDTTLWFSFLYTVPDTTSTNSNFTFALGSAALSTTGTLGAGQSAIGFSIGRNNRPTATYWNNGIITGSKVGTQNNSFVVGSKQLIVGKITWGSASDTVDLYLPATDLALGAVYDTVTTSANLDQGGYTTLSFGGKNATATPQGIDEIRFGATYADVTPIPEPATLGLLGLGGLLIGRRRRSRVGR